MYEISQVLMYKMHFDPNPTDTQHKCCWNHQHEMDNYLQYNSIKITIETNGSGNKTIKEIKAQNFYSSKRLLDICINSVIKNICESEKYIMDQINKPKYVLFAVDVRDIVNRDIYKILSTKLNRYRRITIKTSTSLYN